MKPVIIAIDDEEVFLRSIRRGLLAAGFDQVQTASDPVQALTRFEQGEEFALALIDLRMPGLDGVQVLDRILAVSPTTQCIMISALNDVKTAVTCIRKGAYDYLVKPLAREDLLTRIHNAMEHRRLRSLVNLPKEQDPPREELSPAFHDLLSTSPSLAKLLKEADLHATSDIPMLITGETGVGKEVLAKAIHQASGRAAQPCLTINIASFPQHLFDAEFFGHVKGAFTGADAERTGYLEACHRGTLILDEIGILPYELQGKLLRVLQDGEYQKLGVNRPFQADVRFIALTNENLDHLVQNGRFRKDLYYRLKGAWLHVPPLRDRIADLPHLIGRFGSVFGAAPPEIVMDAEALQVLAQQAWPGNIRELQHTVRAALNRSRGKTIRREHLPEDLNLPQLLEKEASAPISPRQRLADIEKQHILHIYLESGRNKSQTAKTLGIAVNTLRSRLAAYGMD